jgi:hypothetical protein
MIRSMPLRFHLELVVRRGGAAGSRRRGATGQDLAAARSITGMFTGGPSGRHLAYPWTGRSWGRSGTYVPRVPGPQAATQGRWGSRWCRTPSPAMGRGLTDTMRREHSRTCGCDLPRHPPPRGSWLHFRRLPYRRRLFDLDPGHLVLRLRPRSPTRWPYPEIPLRGRA